MKAIVYKLGRTHNNELSAKEAIKFHLLHSLANDNKVLFTTLRGPSPQNREKIKKIILTTNLGDYAVVADIREISKFKFKSPRPEYKIPSVYNAEKDEELTYFELDNMIEIEGGIKKGEYISVNGVDLLKSISKNAFMIYI